MRYGIIILPMARWPEAGRLWQSAEAYGFDHAWTYDHLSWRSLADQPWSATIPTLTAAAVLTKTIRLGTFVSNPNFRHPVPFAKELATLDEISGGRFVLGVGSGAAGSFDSSVLGDPEYSRAQRHDRFVEFVDLLDRLLRFEQDGKGIDFHGDWYTADAARMVGAPTRHPRLPFAVAANGPRGLDVVVRTGQGWITNGPGGVDDEQWWAAVKDLSQRLDDTADRAHRDPADIDRYLSFDSADGSRFALDSVDAFEDASGRASELGFTNLVVHWPRREGVYSGSESVLDEVASRLG
jgi:alkanesulfonate monooxygenase SsuD/methylene tetrahydromethanopterin reductase-like flavin-dependent oxidoreductase (luciferase family)